MVQWSTILVMISWINTISYHNWVLSSGPHCENNCWIISLALARVYGLGNDMIPVSNATSITCMYVSVCDSWVHCECVLCALSVYCVYYEYWVCIVCIECVLCVLSVYCVCIMSEMCYIYIYIMYVPLQVEEEIVWISFF